LQRMFRVYSVSRPIPPSFSLVFEFPSHSELPSFLVAPQSSPRPDQCATRVLPYIKDPSFFFSPFNLSVPTWYTGCEGIPFLFSRALPPSFCASNSTMLSTSIWQIFLSLHGPSPPGPLARKGGRLYVFPRKSTFS